MPESNTIARDFHTLHYDRGCAVLRLASTDVTNKLSRACIADLYRAILPLTREAERGAIQALVVTGNQRYFSVGADLNEVSRYTPAEGLSSSLGGQRLMNAIDRFPVPVIAAINGYCMGGAMDMVLACDFRIASPGAIFGHRGAALGIMTSWGGTQRLPRLIGKARTLQMFLAAETVSAVKALEIGLVDKLADDPLEQALAMSETGLVP